VACFKAAYVTQIQPSKNISALATLSAIKVDKFLDGAYFSYT
jgi:hypothetical protein